MDPSSLLRAADLLMMTLLCLVAALGVLVAWSQGLLMQVGIAFGLVAAAALLARALRSG